jgi:hypothetical protein
LFSTSSLTQERERSSTDELHNKIRRRVFFVLRVAQVKKAKDLFSDKLHTRAHTWKPLSLPFLSFFSAILSTVPPLPPFRHFAIPFFLLFRHSRHSRHSTIPSAIQFRHSVCCSAIPGIIFVAACGGVTSTV